MEGFRIIEKINNSSNPVDIFRATRLSDGLPVVIKSISEETASPQLVVNLRNEFEVLQLFSSENVIRAYSFEKKGNTCFLVMEDGGYSLKELLNGRNRPGIRDFLVIAACLAGILEIIHRKKIIHKDIKPSNFVLKNTAMPCLSGLSVVSSDWSAFCHNIRIIDFGVSTRLKREEIGWKPVSILEGSLPYISPEQTGRVNKMVDYRTDFYSLGITFFELLTGSRPFDSDDPVEMVYSHISMQIPEIHALRHDAPDMVCRIIEKLTEKEADRRYQSASGLRHDLEKCIHRLDEKGFIDFFQPGEKDVSDVFKIPQKLYGREEETRELLSIFDNAASGESSLLLVSGYSGIGKSSFIQETHRAITEKNGFFLQGKYDLNQRDIPFSGIIQAFRSLIGNILSEPEEKLKKWKDRLLDMLGSNGQVIVDVLPELELVIGKQCPVQELGPTENQNRFNLTFRNFLSVFTSKDHPVVLFIDDLQWADTPSLNLVRLIIADPESRYILIIGSYRDNEVDAAHPLISMLENIRKDGKEIRKIHLGPLKKEHITGLVSDTLNVSQYHDEVSELAELLLAKTDGNPFFMGEVLKMLHNREIIFFDYELKKWNLDPEKARACEITDNVVDLMVRKIRQLSKDTQRMLGFSSCLGSRFNLEMLSVVSGHPLVRDIARDLVVAVMDGLMIPEGKGHSLIQMDASSEDELKDVWMRFQHDRVQQAAYSLIDDEEMKRIHLRAGQILLEITPEDRMDEILFEIVDHCNNGRSLIKEGEKRLDLAFLNLRAAKKAKLSTAHETAGKYLSAGLELLPPDNWKEAYYHSREMYKELIEVEFLKGNFDRADELISMTLDNLGTGPEKAEIYRIKITMLLMQSRFPELLETAYLALSLLGMNLPGHSFIDIFHKNAREIDRLTVNRKIHDLIAMPEITDVRMRLTVKLLDSLMAPTYTYSPDLWRVIVSEIVLISLNHGHTSDSPHAFSSYGMIMGNIFGKYETGYEFARLGLDIADRFNTGAQKCIAGFDYGNLVLVWVRHIRNAEDINATSYQCGMASGEVFYANIALTYQVLNHLFQGNSLNDIISEIPKTIQILSRQSNKILTDILKGLKLVTYSLAGKTDDPLCFECDDFPESEYLEACLSPFVLGYYRILKMMALYLYDADEDALELSLSAKKHLLYVSSTFLSSEFNFYHSLILVSAIGRQDSEQEKRPLFDELQSNQNQMMDWARHCPDNFIHKHHLVEAEMARIAKNPQAAMDLYDLAINSARKYGFIQVEALANELAARFWIEQGKSRIAGLYMTEAHALYRRWGALAKVRQIVEKHADLIKRQADIDPESSVHKTVSGHSGTCLYSDSLDLSSILEASRTISGEMVYERLMEKLIRIVIESAGAERAVFISVNDKKELFIAAEGTAHEINIYHEKPVKLTELTENTDGADEYRKLPESLIRYVVRTGENVILSDAVNEGIFTTDPYIVYSRPKSLFCLAMMHSGSMDGILYLENTMVAGAFTRERARILEILSAQAVISIRNALNYKEILLTKKELQKSAEQIQAHLDEYMNLFNNIQDVFYRVDTEGRILLVSPSEERILGYSPEEVIGTCLADLYVNPENRKVFLYEIERKGFVNNFETQLRKKDGGHIWISVCAHYFRDRNGTVLGIEGTARDIDDRKKAEEKNLELQSRLMQAEKMEAIGTLAGGIAHDFNNILSAIIGYSEIAIAVLPDEEKRRPVRNILASAERAASLVKQILTFSRQREPEKKPTDLRNVLIEAVGFMRASIPATIEIHQEIQPGSLIVVMDSTQIHQVIMNLCINAAHAMKKKGGRLYIEMTRTILTGDDRYIADLKPGSYAVLKISDTGCGIDPAHIKRIFDPFFTTKAPGEGTGLGLSVVYGIIKGHDGAIDVQSKVGRGTTFCIYLPEKHDRLSGEQEPADSVTAEGKENILLVDDEKVLVEMGTEILQCFGYNVTGTTSSIEALDLIRSGHQRFDLVITDLTMPVMTGLVLAREIRRTCPSIPIIICSGLNEQSTIDQIDALGSCTFLMKPFTTGTLSKTIRDILDTPL